MKHNLFFFFVAGFFLFIKLPHLSWRISDGNIYLYMALLVNQGALPYQDFFFANPPLHLYFLSLPVYLTKNVLLNLLPTLITIITALILYTTANNFLNKPLAILVGILYLFSFTILSTSDYLTGVHLTSFLHVTSLYLLIKNKPLMAGIYSAMAILTRPYALPAVAGFILAIVIKRKSFNFLITYLMGTFFLPILVAITLNIITQGVFVENTILYHLKKTEGIPKLKVISFFLTHDWLLALSLVFVPLLSAKRYAYIILPMFFLLLFYLLFSDIYYLYFVLIIPFLALSIASLAEKIKLFYSSRGKYLALFIIGVFFTFTIYSYSNHQAPIGKLTNLSEITSFIESNLAQEETLYGVAEITPLVAFLLNRAIAGNFVDTNEKLFLTGTVDIKKREVELSKRNLKFFLTSVYIDKKGNIYGLTRYATTDFFYKTCNQVKLFPITTDYENNALIIWDCQKVKAEYSLE